MEQPIIILCANVAVKGADTPIFIGSFIHIPNTGIFIGNTKQSPKMRPIKILNTRVQNLGIRKAMVKFTVIVKIPAGMKIFIIEDEPAIREELVQLLQKYGYQCDSSDDFHHIVQAALSSGANLILLDINLPYQDGFQVCREIRQKSNLPIIVLTSRNSDFDELMSLNIGADDYIAKPYNAQILLARIQKLLARTYEVQDNIVLTHKGLTLNLLKAEISYQGNKKSLTKNELGILRLLMVNKGNIIPRDAIIDELWQSEQFIDENTLNVNIVRLRKALTEIGLPDYLETKRGLGYCV